MHWMMGKSSRIALVLCSVALFANSFAAVPEETWPVDNVAVQWNYLFFQIMCRQVGFTIEPHIAFAQFNLAQWHALLAVKNTGACTTEDVVVAYASHKILSSYFPFEQVVAIDPLLLTQLKTLGVSDSEQKLGKQLGEAVALDLIDKRYMGREFALQALKKALDAEADAPRPGMYHYTNNTPAGRDAALFVFYEVPFAQPYVVPEPTIFIKKYLSDLKPPRVPSDEWDREYELVKNLGRLGWEGRTTYMNYTAAIFACPRINSNLCYAPGVWSAVIRATLPKRTSLYDTVTLFAKFSVALHDSLIVLTTVQYGFYFWRPIHAFRDGDPRHAPIPDWNSFLPTPPHAEYPSGTVATVSTAAGILENFFGKGVDVPFLLPGTGVFGPGCPVQGPVPDRNFSSFADLVRAYQETRVYAGAHFNISVIDGLRVGEEVSKYVESHWTERPSSGALPNPSYLSVFAELPKKQTGWSPMKFVF